MRHKKLPSKYFYFMMNKACGTVCSSVSDRRHTVYEAFPPDVLNLDGVKLHTVGRLDADTEGLLLLTNDGKFSDFLSRPVNKIPKTYLVSLKNCVSTDAQNEYISLAAAGLTLPAEKKAPVQQANPAEIQWIDSTNCKISVTEGKFHEVKRIFRVLGNEVLALKRVSFGSLELDESLAPGQYRNLTENEVNLLYNNILF